MFRYRHTFVASMVVSVASMAFAVTSGAATPPFTGVINNNDVYVRSGASKNYYDVAKLQSGTVVQVRELLYGWYAIDPPAGSFSYVSQAYVQLAADGKTGTVTGDNVRVRAPAAGGPSRSYKIQTKLDKGAVVTVLGAEEDYYKIVPPQGVVLYVAENFIAPAPGSDERRAMSDEKTEAPSPETRNSKPETPAPGTTAIPTTVTTPTEPTPTTTVTPTPTAPEPAPAPSMPVAEAPAPAPAPTAPVAEIPAPETPATPVPAPETQNSKPETPAPAPAPSAPPAPSSAQLLAQAEQHYAQADKLPLAQQPIDTLLAGYQSLTGAQGLTDQQAALVTARVGILTSRLEIQRALTQVAEEQVKVEKIKAELPKNYIVIGKLITSTVFTGDQAPLMYRLIDPLTGMSICYVEPVKGMDFQSYLGYVIGIVGKSRYDTGMTLKVVRPAEIDILTPQAPQPPAPESPESPESPEPPEESPAQ